MTDPNGSFIKLFAFHMISPPNEFLNPSVKMLKLPQKRMIRIDSVVGWDGDQSPPPPSHRNLAGGEYLRNR